MILYFTGCSKQMKYLIDTDYVEDIYDEIETFFEEHKIQPHIIDLRQSPAGYELWFGSMSERFVIEGMDDNSASEFKAMYQ